MTTTTIPFAVPFPELCMEVSQHWSIDERVLRGIKGKVIMHFIPEAMKSAFQWVGEGSYEYSEAESLALYQATNKSTRIRAQLHGEERTMQKTVEERVDKSLASNRGKRKEESTS